MSRQTGRPRLFESAVEGATSSPDHDLETSRLVRFSSSRNRHSDEFGRLRSEPYSARTRRRVNFPNARETEGATRDRTFKTSNGSVSYSPVYRGRRRNNIGHDISDSEAKPARQIHIPVDLKKRISGKPAERNSGSRPRGDAWIHDIYEDQNPSAYNEPRSQIFIRGLGQNISEDFLKKLVQSTAGCEICTIRVDRGTLTTALIGFKQRDAATKVKEAHNGASIDGEIIKVSVVEDTNRKPIPSILSKRSSNLEKINMSQRMVADSESVGRNVRTAVLTDGVLL